MIRLIGGTCAHAIVLLLPSLCLICWGASVDVFAYVLFSVLLLLAGLLESALVEPRFDPNSARVTDPVAMRVAAIAGLLMLALFWLAQILGASASNKHVVGYTTVLACSMVVTGATLRLLAIWTLKEQFVSDVCWRGAKVNTGVYRWLNHPGEWGQWLIAVGSTLILSPIASCAAVVLMTPIAIWRIRREERLLGRTTNRLASEQHLVFEGS